PSILPQRIMSEGAIAAGSLPISFASRSGASVSLAGPVIAAAGCLGDLALTGRGPLLAGLAAVTTRTAGSRARRGRGRTRVVEATGGVLYDTQRATSDLDA